MLMCACVRLSELEVRQLWRRSRQGYQNMQDDELQVCCSELLFWTCWRTARLLCLSVSVSDVSMLT